METPWTIGRAIRISGCGGRWATSRMLKRCCALAFVVIFSHCFEKRSDIDSPQVLVCGHRHGTSGVTSQLLVAEHPRGITAMVEICNTSAAPIRVSSRCL